MSLYFIFFSYFERLKMNHVSFIVKPVHSAHTESILRISCNESKGKNSRKAVKASLANAVEIMQCSFFLSSPATLCNTYLHLILRDTHPVILARRAVMREDV